MVALRSNAALLRLAIVSSIGLLGVLASASPALAVTPQPQSASGCTTDSGDLYNVCIYVNGDSYHVNNVAATQNIAYRGSACASATMFVNGQAYITSQQQCGQNSLSQDFTVNANFNDGTAICVSWDNVPDLSPCETIQA